MSTYEIGLLGDVTDADRDTLVAAIAKLIADFDLEVGRDVMVRVGDAFDEREGRAATAAAYFGGMAQADQELTRRAFASSLPVIQLYQLLAILVSWCPPFSKALTVFAAVQTILRCWSWLWRSWNVSAFSGASAGCS